MTCLAFLPPTASTSSSPLLLSGSADSTIILWSILQPPPANKVRRFRYHRSVVNAVAPSPSDPTLFASGSDDGNVCIWKTDERKPWEVLKVGYPVTALEWTKDGSGLFVGGIDNQIHVSATRWELEHLNNSTDSHIALSHSTSCTTCIASKFYTRSLRTRIPSLSFASHPPARSFCHSHSTRRSRSGTYGHLRSPMATAQQRQMTLRAKMPRRRVCKRRSRAQ